MYMPPAGEEKPIAVPTRSPSVYSIPPVREMTGPQAQYIYIYIYI